MATAERNMPLEGVAFKPIDRERLNLHGQLEYFLIGVTPNARRLLTSDDMDVHVRYNTRPFGYPSRTIEIDGRPLLLAGNCLEIGDVQLKNGVTIYMKEDAEIIADGTSLDPWNTFMDRVPRIAKPHGIDLLYMDDIYDSRFSRWCEENGWVNTSVVLNKPKTNCYFMWI